MYNYKYQGEDSDGNSTSGMIEAESKDQALSVLARRDLIITSISKVGDESSAKGGFKLSIPSLKMEKVKYDDLANFSDELAALISSGIALPDSIELMLKDDSNKTLNEALKEILQEIRAGTSFSKALDNHQSVFPPVFSALVKSGEGTGAMDKALQQLSDYFQNLDSIRNRIISAMAYPVVVVGMAAVILSGLFVYAVPKFTHIYDQLGVPLPVFTRVMLGVAGYVEIAIKYGLVALPFVLFFLYGYLKTDGGKLTADKLKLKFPILGPVFEQVAIANFCKTLSILNANGVQLQDSVSLAAHASNNRYLINRIIVLEKPLNEGKKLSEAFGQTNILTPQVLGMLEAGEKSGKLALMLSKVAGFTGNRSAHEIERLLSLLEPVMIAFIGVMVGTAIITLAGPLLNISSAIKP